MKPLKLHPFWKVGLTNLLLVAAALVTVDAYAVRVLRRDYARRSFAALESLARLAESRRPDFGDLPALQSWTAWLARGGARVTVVSAEGRVLVDSNADPARAQDQAELPEIRSALETGEGRATRYDGASGRDLVYLARRSEGARGVFVVLGSTVWAVKLR